MTRTNIQTIDNVGKNNVLGPGWTSEKEIKPLNGLSTTHADKIYCSFNGLLSKTHADKIYCSFNGLVQRACHSRNTVHSVHGKENFQQFLISNRLLEVVIGSSL